MNGDSSAPSGLDFRAVGIGMIWGLLLMLAGAVIQTVAATASPLSEVTVGVLKFVWQGLGALVGGYMAARRAGSSGWLHGALSGAALVMALAAVMGFDSLPTLAYVLKSAGIGAGAGILGGVVGVGGGNR
jgi:putative membrane protein (TIGR04086 family)